MAQAPLSVPTRRASPRHSPRGCLALAPRRSRSGRRPATTGGRRPRSRARPPPPPPPPPPPARALAPPERAPRAAWQSPPPPPPTHASSAPRLPSPRLSHAAGVRPLTARRRFFFLFLAFLRRCDLSFNRVERDWAGRKQRTRLFFFCARRRRDAWMNRSCADRRWKPRRGPPGCWAPRRPRRRAAGTNRRAARAAREREERGGGGGGRAPEITCCRSRLPPPSPGRRWRRAQAPRARSCAGAARTRAGGPRRRSGWTRRRGGRRRSKGALAPPAPSSTRAAVRGLDASGQQNHVRLAAKEPRKKALAASPVQTAAGRGGKAPRRGRPGRSHGPEASRATPARPRSGAAAGTASVAAGQARRVRGAGVRRCWRCRRRRACQSRWRSIAPRSKQAR